MSKRPILNNKLDSETFKIYYFLKSELVNFCKKNHLQTTGNKLELINRISIFLDTKEKTYQKHNVKKCKKFDKITLESIIENDFVCSEKHRAFFKQQIGNSFTFIVPFQKWLKNNSGKTYKDSIDAYHQILKNNQSNKTIIDKQFEYNKYIRDFFNNNNDKNLNDAIKCWKYKKTLSGHNRYEQSDLIALKLN